MGTAQGVVQAFVLAGEMTPSWAQQAPACITAGRRLLAIRSEVSCSAHTSALMILSSAVVKTVMVAIVALLFRKYDFQHGIHD